METFTKIIAFFKGKKVYLLALAVIAYGVYLKFFAETRISWEEFIEKIYDGTLLAAARAALAKIKINV